MKIPKKEKKPSLSSYGVLIENHAHGPDFKTITHSHPHHSLLYIVAGQGRCIIGKNKKKFSLTSNTAIFLKANQPHQMIDSPSKAMTVFVVYFDQTLANSNPKILSFLLKSSEPILTPPHKAQHLRRTLRRMLYEQDRKSPQFAVAMQQCLSEILLELYRIALGEKRKKNSPAHQNSENRTTEVLEYVAEYFYEPQSLPGAAKMASLSQRQFSTMCRKITTQSFVQYVNQLRAQKAADLLKNTNMPVAAIAFEVGFEELSTFYRAFNRFHKTTPLAYRESC